MQQDASIFMAGLGHVCMSAGCFDRLLLFAIHICTVALYVLSWRGSAGSISAGCRAAAVSLPTIPPQLPHMFVATTACAVRWSTVRCLGSVQHPITVLCCLLWTLLQVSTILHRATSRSLVLLDEFGKGTLTSDGVGLLASILQHYTAQPVPPMLLACTHFVELLGPEVLPPHPQLQLCTMQVLVAGRSSGDDEAAAAAARGVEKEERKDAAAAAGIDEEHVFLYKLVQGKVAASYGVSADCWATCRF